MNAALLSPTSTLPLVEANPLPLQWSNRFATLGSEFFTELKPVPIPDPTWVATSRDCSELLGWPVDWAERGEPPALQVLSGNALWHGTRPLASVYSGHQFGVWAGQLGDGRALWLGELNTPGGALEVQLKGSGLTPYSRMGDGRAVLRSSIREFLCSEAMAALGIPTTRALCVTGSPLPVRREEVETAAVVTRVAPSFIRFGHFEHFASQDAPEKLRRLADFVIDQYHPECREAAQPYCAFLETVTRRTALMVADWQAVGFCHGVMNTDNMSILGLTIDYGPFGFLDGFDPGHICNHSDHQGRYAYARQPSVALWNLHALAQALLPLIGEPDAALAALEPYRSVFSQGMLARLSAKLGLATAQEGDSALIDDLMTLMAKERSDFTITFRRLASFASTAGDANTANRALRDLFIDHAAFDAWAKRYAQRLQIEGSVDAARALRMNRVNPSIVLRNHLAEGAISRAREGDFSEVQRLHDALRHPFDEPDDYSEYAAFPPDWARGIEVSCSS
jgi:serine/tyrosine/threonine adenylyltransferase